MVMEFGIWCTVEEKFVHGWAGSPYSYHTIAEAEQAMKDFELPGGYEVKLLPYKEPVFG
jgi:hypothetical protein